MDQLSQIITQRLKLINHYRSLPPETLFLNKQAYADELIKQKRKQSSRQVIQTRLLQAISSRRIEAPYRKQEFFRQSQQMMKMFDPEFSFVATDDSDVLTTVVNLYVAFFNKQECERRAEELVHIYKKGLCQKGMIIPTIMNWFIDWLRKAFRVFLKDILQQLTAKDKKEKYQKKRKLPPDVNEQVENYKRSIEQIEHKIQTKKKQEVAGWSKLLQPEKKSSGSKMLAGRKSSLLNPNLSKNLKESIEVLEEYKTLQLNRSPSISEIVANQLSKSPSISVLRKKQPQGSKEVYSGPVYNKEIFFSAFYDELGDYYKQYGGFMQLDNSFPKSLRRINRKEQFKSKFVDISKSLAKNQILIKKTHQDYLQNYEKYQKKQWEKKMKKISLEKAKTNAEVNNRAKFNALSDRQIQNSETRFKKKPRKSPEEKYQILRPSLYSKTIQIELPIVDKSPIGNKVSTINLKRERYQEETKQMHRRNKFSMEIYKDMQEVNSIFQRNSSPRLKFSARKVQDKFSARRRYVQVQEQEQENEKREEKQKIFKFPRIGR